MASSVSQLQQVLFIVFTIVGFFLCIISVALRADMWFKDEWSSFILGTFAPYIVSACLAAKIFLLETGKGGLRFVKFRLEDGFNYSKVYAPKVNVLNIKNKSLKNGKKSYKFSSNIT